MLFIKLYIYQKILKNKEYHHFHTKYEAAKLLLKTSNDEENSALHHRNNIL